MTTICLPDYAQFLNAKGQRKASVRVSKPVTTFHALNCEDDGSLSPGWRNALNAGIEACKSRQFAAARRCFKVAILESRASVETYAWLVRLTQSRAPERLTFAVARHVATRLDFARVCMSLSAWEEGVGQLCEAHFELLDWASDANAPATWGKGAYACLPMTRGALTQYLCSYGPHSIVSRALALDSFMARAASSSAS